MLNGLYLHCLFSDSSFPFRRRCHWFTYHPQIFHVVQLNPNPEKYNTYEWVLETTGKTWIQFNFRASVQARPAPLPLRLTPEEEAAHAAFVGSLGPNALWNRYLQRQADAG